MKVTTVAEITEFGRKRIVFKLEAHDQGEPIVTGSHERVIISMDRFLARVAEKAQGLINR